MTLGAASRTDSVTPAANCKKLALKRPGINDVHRCKGDAEVTVDEIAGREVQAADGSEPLGAPATRGITPCSWMPKTALESPDEAQVDGLAVLPLLGFLGLIM